MEGQSQITNEKRWTSFIHQPTHLSASILPTIHAHSSTILDGAQIYKAPPPRFSSYESNSDALSFLLCVCFSDYTEYLIVSSPWY